MSIQPNSLWRGCAANFQQPVNEEDQLAAQFLVETVYYFNCRVGQQPLSDIYYRSSNGEYDILHHVFRWDLTPYQDVFRNGFQARRQQNTHDNIYYNLNHYVHHGGRPLDTRREATHAFVSTTLNSNWHPTVNRGVEIDVFRYEIYAPGGIIVSQTLGENYEYPAQDEVCFVAGIAPQYIRSAQQFRLVVNGSYTRRARVDNRIRVNGNFNPQSHPSRFLTIRRPICAYRDEENHSRPLTIVIYRGDALQREKRQVPRDTDITDWYAQNVSGVNSYINAAFRSSRKNEAYIFMNDEYALLNYAPGTTNDSILNGPLLISDGYPSLKGTSFANYGIDCAFGDGEEAFIFSGNLCAKVDYAPGTTNDKITRGPMTITTMFPFFKGTVFEDGVDAAFESSRKNEAYLFKGNKYSLINFTNSRLIAIRLITEGFFSLKGTIFESGIDAAFASHRKNEAYLFKGSSYALINFAPASTDDYIIGGVKEITRNWPSLRGILPRTNKGLDINNQNEANTHRDQDEL
ncbi:ADP-ribosylation-containing protein [Dioscorea alata]|uniref:ADP-ribosylation-containing protein n=1 Tax=Dioscorea alata TaxID=55571 RepID=A0ACB7WME6_DIOAL|nr:ADP-ribosylation-containing protein [Dioscorea alata]